MQEVVLNDVLFPSLKRLYDVDYENILYGVSERNICARLAHHMENLMREYDKKYGDDIFSGYFADVEYNRMGNGDPKHYENSEHMPKYMVSDLLIQSRGEERNMLAVEMKRKGNNRGVREDRVRLLSLVSSSSVRTDRRCVHDTLVGAFIVYSPKDVRVELFENVDGRGTMTCVRYFILRNGALREDLARF